MVDPLQSPDAERAGPKVIGRRDIEAVDVEQALALQETVAALLPPLSGVRGVFRFDTFEEAQAWLQEQMTISARASRRAKMSSASPSGSTSSEPATR